jgi:hypothetical protein
MKLAKYPDLPRLKLKLNSKRILLEVTLVYFGLHWFTLVYIGLHWFTLVYIGLHWFTLVYIGLPGLGYFQLVSFLTSFLNNNGFIYMTISMRFSKDFQFFMRGTLFYL